MDRMANCWLCQAKAEPLMFNGDGSPSLVRCENVCTKTEFTAEVWERTGEAFALLQQMIKTQKAALAKYKKDAKARRS